MRRRRSGNGGSGDACRGRLQGSYCSWRDATDGEGGTGGENVEEKGFGDGGLEGGLVRCALGYRYERPAVFEPAAALAPGEDWRPPGGVTCNAAGAKEGTSEAPRPEGWAAGEVERRDDMNRRVGQALEAEMELSPTLGRWPAHMHGAGREDEGERGLPVEDLAENVVEVSGLRFAVDLCASSSGSGEHARFLML
jgi:hypothetical protein